MNGPSRRTRTAAGIIITLSVVACGDMAAAETGDFLLIDRQLDTRPISIATIDEITLTWLDEAGELRDTPLDDCLAIVQSSIGAPRETEGLLVLSNGQRLPGNIARETSPGENMLAWNHPWLGRIDVPVDRLSALTLRSGQPLPAPGRADLVVLANGDRLEGFITNLGDPLSIEITTEDGPRVVEAPLAHVVALSLITPRKEAAGRRVWFTDGTVLDVRSLAVGADGYVRLGAALTGESTTPIQIRVPDIAAILFTERSLVPLASLAPLRISTTAPRYVLPEPEALDERAPLDLSRVEYCGPLIVHYAAPAGCRRFAAEAVLPPAARAWGDFELVICDDEEEVYRRRLNAEHPRDTINVPLTGSELTIELTQGEHGPIQDRLVLERAMLLVE